MGSGPSLPEVDALRGSLISSFNSQRILLLGRYGSGKTSVINTFNHVINLVEEDFSTIEQVAEMGSSIMQTKTCRCTSYGSNEGMYRSLKNSKVSDQQKLYMKAPAFIDTPGIPTGLKVSTEREIGRGLKVEEMVLVEEMKTFYKRVLEGSIPNDFDLQKYFVSVSRKFADDADAAAAAPTESLAIPLTTEKKKIWAVVAVLSVSSEKDKKMTDETQTKQLSFLIDLKTANDSLNQGTRIFVIFTKSDIAGMKEKEKLVLRDRAANALNCSRGNIFFFENYSDKDTVNNITKRNLSREKSVIEAFMTILAPWSGPKSYHD